MAAHTPIASAIAASSQPSFAFSKLQDLRASFERLRGLQIDALKAMGFDTLLDDLASICDALTELDRINADMGVTDSALTMLLHRSCRRRQVRPAGLSIASAT
ncbi:hypothetical protein [Undibacterium umbellatum]|uniref:Uncharacterized protein n=2 Tax=Undibacterium TaxID=401469 RepID=A0ABR6Z2Y1_9BURK|nr:hypothetical protein [Undibacterium umbellatum]MBC3905939.1 hypothetical protein [Undibacterium umbellatum]